VKLQAKQYCSDDSNYGKYCETQIERHAKKKGKRRQIEHYQKCADVLGRFVEARSQMVCLGTRNNHERDVFTRELSSKQVKVFSLDIAPDSDADFVMDFNRFNGNWEGKWDIVFSNSIDHAIDATEVFEEWVKIVRCGGYLMLGFNVGDMDISGSDCNAFEDEQVVAFFRQREDVQLLTDVENGYKYYLLRRI